MKKNTIVYIKLLLITLIILGLIAFLSKNLNISYNIIPNIISHDKYISFNIVKDSESDKEVINTTFMNGMSVDAFKNVLKLNKENILKGEFYRKITYNFETPLNYSDLESFYRNMNNSDICNVEIIGKSVDKRNIYGIEVGRGDKVLFIDTNIHAAEVGNVVIITRFLSELVNKYEENDEDTIKLLNNVKIAVIPSINPDGYEVYNFGAESINNKDLWIYKNKDEIDFKNIKSNANGVDLNRNFPTQLSGMVLVGNTLHKNTKLTPDTNASMYYNGDTVGSEPETRAVMYFMLKHYKNVYAYVDMHSQGRVIYAGKPNLSKDFNNSCVSLGNKVVTITKYKVHKIEDETVGMGTDGSATDFMAELANGFSFSTTTGRLTSDNYIGNSSTFVNKFPVITLETMKVWSKDPSVYKTEYYNYGIRSLLYSLIKN